MLSNVSFIGFSADVWSRLWKQIKNNWLKTTCPYSFMFQLTLGGGPSLSVISFSWLKNVNWVVVPMNIHCQLEDLWTFSCENISLWETTIWELLMLLLYSWYSFISLFSVSHRLLQTALRYYLSDCSLENCIEFHFHRSGSALIL